MYRFAQINPEDVLLDLQNRISMEIPSSLVKEEHMYGLENSNKATYVCVFRRSDKDKISGRIEDTLTEMLREVLSEYNVIYRIEAKELKDNLVALAIAVAIKPDRIASYSVGTVLTHIPVTMYVGQSVYSLATDKKEFFILRDGSVVSDGMPSSAYALGKLYDFVSADLASVELFSGLSSSLPHDFVAGVTDMVVHASNIDKTAKTKLVEFYELVTSDNFAAAGSEDI